MFRLGCNKMFALSAIGLGNTLKGKVVRFGCPAGKNNFFSIGVNLPGNYFSRVFYRLFRNPTESMLAACCVAEMLRKKGIIASTTRVSACVVA